MINKNLGTGFLIFFYNFIYLFLLFIFNWRIVALQCCVGFCHTATWSSHKYTYICSFLSLPLTPAPISPLWVITELGWAPCIIRQLPTNCLFYTWQSIHVKATLSIRPTHSFPYCVHKSVLYVCISITTARTLSKPRSQNDLARFDLTSKQIAMKGIILFFF